MRALLRLAIAQGAEHDHVGGVQRPRHEVEQRERAEVGRVQVVEHDQDRIMRRELAQRGRKGVQPAEPRCIGDVTRTEVGHTRLVVELGKQSREPLANRVREQRLVEVAAQRTDRLNPRPKGGSTAGLPGTSPHHGVAAIRGEAGGFFREATLADSGLATKDDGSTAPARTIVERSGERGELRLPSHEGFEALRHGGSIPQVASASEVSEADRVAEHRSLGSASCRLAHGVRDVTDVLVIGAAASPEESQRESSLEVREL